MSTSRGLYADGNNIILPGKIIYGLINNYFIFSRNEIIVIVKIIKANEFISAGEIIVSNTQRAKQMPFLRFNLKHTWQLANQRMDLSL